jgi:cytochrome c biogenesis protein CcdA
MGILLGTAFLVGVLTALTPCVLPVLPVVLAVGPGGSRWRPYAIIAGLVISFTLFTVFWTAVLDALPIPADLLRDLAIAIIALTAISLLVPKVAELAAKPFEPLARIAPKTEWNGVVLGLALGLVFTPCAGLLIGSVASAAATQEYSWRLIAVVLAYAIGAGLSLLAISPPARGSRCAGSEARLPASARRSGPSCSRRWS